MVRSKRLCRSPARPCLPARTRDKSWQHVMQMPVPLTDTTNVLCIQESHVTRSICDYTLGQPAERSASACATDLPVPICEHMAGQLAACAAAAGAAKVQTGSSAPRVRQQG